MYHCNTAVSDSYGNCNMKSFPAVGIVCAEVIAVDYCNNYDS